MDSQNGRWGRTIFWGAATAALYAAMFTHSELLLHMAHTTPDACIIGQAGEMQYFHKIDAATCAAKGGRFEPGTWWHVLIPILLAFAISYVHGAFTGLFWNLMGLKPARK
jgi:ribose/xylose/arabinose/galactoside ABC-type transport system permease subunit